MKKIKQQCRAWRTSSSLYLKLFMLLAVFVGSVGSAWAQLLPTTRYSLENVGSNSFALVNLNDGKAIYGTGAQNLAYGYYSDAFAYEDKCFEFKLEEANGHYLLKALLHDGRDYIPWPGAQGYLNSQPSGGMVSFILGLNDQYGQDGSNLALWDFESNGDGIYKLKNVGTGKYLNNAGAALNDTGVSWSLCSIGAGCAVSFYSNNNEWGTVTAKRLDTNEDITSGTKVPYGTVIELTAHPKTGYKLQNWSNSSTALTRQLTVLGNVNPGAFFEAESGYTVTFSSNNTSLGTVTATANGNPINSGDKVAAGTEVTFTANPISPNLIYNWSYDNYHEKSVKKTINADYSVVANFTAGIVLTAQTNDIVLGTAKVQHWEGTGSSVRICPNPGTVKFVATPSAGCTFDGWYSDEARTIEVSKEQEYTKSGLTDQNFTLYAKFSGTVDDTTIGTDSKDTGWYLNGGANALSNKYTLNSMKEYTFEFDINRGTALDAWNSFAVIGSNGTFSDANTKFVLRPDNFAFDHDGNDDGVVTGAVADGNSNPTLALKDGTMTWETFKNDLDGAHVKVKVSFDGTKVYVYEVITKGDHTYTYHYPYAYSGSSIDLYVAADKTKLTGFTASVVDAYKVFGEPKLKGVDGKNESVGTVKIMNTENVEILDGSVVGVGTKMTIIATPKAGYLFDGWGQSGVTTPSREFTQDAQSHTFYADFVPKSEYETEWTLAIPNDYLFAKDGEGNLVPWTETTNSQTGVVNGYHTPATVTTYSGAYNSSGVENPGTLGIEFNNKVTQLNGKSNTICLDALGGSMKFSVREGEVIIFTVNSANVTRSVTVTNTDGSTQICGTKPNTDITYVIAAKSDGEFIIKNTSASMVYLFDLKKTFLYDFIFADGDEVAATPGTSDYINQIAAAPGFPLLEEAKYTWSSSRPDEVQVDTNTGAITVNESFTGGVTITATRAPYDVYPAVSKSYLLTATAYKLAHETDIIRELGDDGNYVYDEDAYWVDGSGNKIAETNPIYENDIKYEIVSVTKNKAISKLDDDGYGTSEITIMGAGTTIVRAYSGAISCTYTITTIGFVFNDAAPIHDFSSNSFTPQPIDGYDVTYEKVKVIGEMTDGSIIVNSTTGEVTGLPDYGKGGGAIVVKATTTVNSEEKSTFYVLTVPYKKYTWNFYQEEGLTDDATIQALKEINGHKHLTMGDLAPSNPHAASEIIPLDGVTIPNTGDKYPGKYVTDDIYNATEPPSGLSSNDERVKNWNQKQHILRELTWKAFQNGSQTNDQTEANAHLYWDYTFKTRDQKKNGVANKEFPVNYMNEPLFSYKKAVNGNNARIVEDTQGLIFTCTENAFGINDSHALYDKPDSYREAVGGTQRSPKGVREMDRAILVKTGNSFTVPYVQAGDYVKLHWYRHSDNAGDMFRVSNACDLDDVEINPKHDLRFTGSHYDNSGGPYNGYTIVRAKENGPVTFTITSPASWVEIYTVEVTDKYSTELKVIHQKVNSDDRNDGWGGPTNAGYTKNVDVWDMDTEVVHIVRDSRNNDTHNRDNLSVYESVDKDNSSQGYCATTPSNQFGANPIIYIGSYPGSTLGWNGWTLDVECNPVPEDKSKLKINCQVPLMTRIGNNISYGVHALTDFKGTGTAHVIVRTKNGSVNGSPRYTLDKQEAYFPVGEYQPQEYPYTWDFRQYNIEGTKDGSNGIRHRNMSSAQGGYEESGKIYGSYGSWQDSKMATWKEVIATIQPVERTPKKYNKFLFADGSQLTMNQGDDDGATYIREAEGLRVDLSGGWTNSLSWNSNTSVTMDGNFLSLNGTVTVPEVNKDMYVFVRSNKKPKSVIGAVEVTNQEVIHSMDDNFEYNPLKKKNIPMKKDQLYDDSWVYKVTGANIGQHARYTLTQQWWGVKSPVGSYTVIKEGSKTGDVPNKGYIKAIVEFADAEGAPSGLQWCVIPSEGDAEYKEITPGVKTETLDFAKTLVLEGTTTIKQFFIQNAGTSNPTFTINKFVLVDDEGKETPVVTNVDDASDHFNLLWSDVDIKFDDDTKIWGIGVTDEFKMMTNGDGWATDSRVRRIDYNETNTFTKNDLYSYVANTKPAEMTGQDSSGKITITHAPVVLGQSENTSNYRRGLILEDKKNTANKTVFGGERRLIPLFVPACNIPNSDLSHNLIVDHINEEANVAGSDASSLVYVFTNVYYDYNYTDQHFVEDKKHIVEDYSYYIVRQGGKMRGNSSYLKVDNSSGQAKQLYLFFEGGNEADAIEDPDIIDSVHTAGIYTLGGIKLESMPSHPGVYIVDGKKVVVK